MRIHSLDGYHPIIISIPHDGWLHPPNTKPANEAAKRDLGTLELAQRCLEELGNYELKPALIWTDIHRRYVDMNRSPAHKIYSEECALAYDEFHKLLNNKIGSLLETWPHCLLLDLHGYINSPGPETYDFVIGSANHTTSPKALDRFLATQLKQHSRVVFSPDVDLAVNGSFSGGWIIRSTASAWSARGLEAIQLECNRHTRESATINSTALILARAIALSYQRLNEGT